MIMKEKTNAKTNGTEALLDLQNVAVATIKTIKLVGRACSFNELARILRADNPDYYRDPSHASLETTGLFSDRSRLELRMTLGCLLEEGLLTLQSLRYQRLEITEAGEKYYQKPAKLMVGIERVRITPFELYFHRHLRDLRTKFAVEKGIPPYMVYSDHIIDQISKGQPETLKELSLIVGMDDEKIANFGAHILQALDQLQINWHHVKNLNLLSKLRNFTHQEVRRLHKEGFTVEEIAGIVSVKQSTVERYLCDFHAAGVLDLRPWIEGYVDPEILKKSLKYFKGKEDTKLREAKQALGYEYNDLFLARVYAKGFNPLPVKESA